MKKITLLLFIILTATFSFGQECWKQVAVGQAHAVGIKENGTLWSWGQDGGWGRLGQGNTSILQTPTQIGNDTDWEMVAVKSNHVLALKTNGTLWVWGSNSEGQLGLGLTSGIVSTPTQLGSETWKTFATGTNHTLAIKSDGTLWAWGYNQLGAVGDGTLVSKNTPVLISSDTNWKEVSCNLGRSIAIKEDNTLWTWGVNSPFLGLGWDFGGMAHITTPTQLGAESNWKTAVASFGYSMAIKLDQTLWAWGGNDNGHFGSGNTNPAPLPIQIGTDSNWEAINANGFNSCGLKSDGTIWTWGQNTYGQIGNNTTENQLTPYQVSSETNWKAIETGFSFSVALDNNGSMYTWGWNFYGQLGNGTTVDELTPAIVTNCTLSHGSEQMMEVSLYPNPARDHVNLTIQNSGQYELYALNGMLLQKGILETGANTINLSSFATGNYLLKIMDDHGNVEHLKVVKQ